MTDLPVPPFHDSDNASRWDYRPDAAALLDAAAAWRREHAITPAGEDVRRTQLLLVDVQKDFCLPEGSLYVGGRSGRGAIEDSDRIARFIYRNLTELTEITCTLDSHLPFQIFFPSFWTDAKGRPLAAHREITASEVRQGVVRPRRDIAQWICSGNYEWLRRQVAYYCEELEREGKYRLYLWPPHCLLGSPGHALVGVIQEARLFHSFVRGARDGVEVKGNHALTENYSALSPELLLRHDGGELAQRNTALIEELLAADRIVVAGQAASHCVRSTVDDLLAEIQRRDATMLRKVSVLADCMSAVTVPDPDRPGRFLHDFTPQVEEALERYDAAGVHVVLSTDPIPDRESVGAPSGDWTLGLGGRTAPHGAGPLSRD